jgi:hypothetical protein
VRKLSGLESCFERRMNQDDLERTRHILIMLSSGVHAYEVSEAEGCS